MVNKEAQTKAQNIYENSYCEITEDFLPDTIAEMFDDVLNECNHNDEHFFCDFYDRLRDFAYENEDFANALMKSERMSQEDIYGLS